MQPTVSAMELISTDAYLILQPLQKGENNVWICRKTAKFEVRPAWDLASQDNPGKASAAAFTKFCQIFYISRWRD
jgi:hypothetical protein